MNIGSEHASMVDEMGLLVTRQIDPKRFYIRYQNPLSFTGISEPEPDLALVSGNPANYRNRHPSADECRLIIEVADSSLKHDCETKAGVYARAEIADYWVLNLRDRQLIWFSEPDNQACLYRNHHIFMPTETVSLTLENQSKIEFSLSEVFPENQNS